MIDSLVCELCGQFSPAKATTCSQCGCPFALSGSSQASRGVAVDPLVLAFGFRAADTQTSDFQEAEAKFLSSLSSPAMACNLGYKRDEVLENTDAYYFPVGWIGCSGNLVTKNPLRLIGFGSYIGPGLHIWAHYQGISIAPLGKDRKNTLKILSIRDQENTLRVLNTFLNSSRLDRELLPKLSTIPTEFRDVDLYFGIRDLLEAREKGWFEFEVV